jgi:hypothetical protein
MGRQALEVDLFEQPLFRRTLGDGLFYVGATHILLMFQL